MITAVFSRKDGLFNAFLIKGHSLTAPAGNDIVCAAVSSAAYFAANLLEKRSCASVRDGKMEVSVPQPDSVSEQILQNLYRHLLSISVQYPSALRLIRCNIKGGTTNA